MKSGRVKAPSHKITQGSMTVYLFSPEDIQEIKAATEGKIETRDNTVTEESN